MSVPGFLSNEDLKRLEDQYPELRTGKCPTCADTKVYRWKGAEWACLCDEQKRLYVRYLNAGIGDTYQRLSWSDLAMDPEQYAPAQDYLDNAEDYVRAGMGLLLHGPVGCIQGDAVIGVNRGGKGFKIKLQDLVRRLNGQDGRYRWDLSIPTYVQREVEGVVRLAKVSNAWASGVKLTYAVTTDSGRQIRATDEHPFLTERGWLRLDELKMDDEVHVLGSQAAGRPRLPKPDYLCVASLLAHPHCRNAANNHRVLVHRLVAEAAVNLMTFDQFVEVVRRGQVAELDFLDPELWAVHHRDHDPFNNVLENLQVLSHEEHHRLHAEEGKTRSVLFKVATERVVEIKKHGLEETFDLEVEGDPHNFLANGFVVHNTGKTLLGNLVLKELVKLNYTCFGTTFASTVEAFTAGWGNNKAEKDWFARKFMHSQVLLLDDLGKEFRSAAGLSPTTFDHIIRTRVQSARPTILTTNMTAQELQNGYGSAVLSMLVEQSVEVELQGEDFRPQRKGIKTAEVKAKETRPIT